MGWLARLWEWLTRLFGGGLQPDPDPPPPREPYLLAGEDEPLRDRRGPFYWRKERG